MVNEKLRYLLNKYLEKSSTKKEDDELFSLLFDLEDWGQIESILQDKFDESITSSSLSDEFDKDRILFKIREHYPPQKNKRKIWKFLYSAAACMLLGMGIYFFQDIANEIQQDQALSEDVMPGGNRAVLTLSNGHDVLLDTLGVNRTVIDGNYSITKLSNGEISYQKLDTKKEEEIFNHIKTPVGGIFQIGLPDGSKLWLNASTKIRYPLNFSANERAVDVDGEVYFEVAKDKNRPFLVSLPNDKYIKVLGTHFNVNTYNPHKQITTVTEGLVEVGNLQNKQLLSINQQLVVENEKFRLFKNDFNMDEVLAWKEGYFSMTSISPYQLAQDIERWYGVKVQMKNLNNKEFVVRLKKDLSLKDLITILELTGEVKFELNNKTLNIMNK